MVITRLHGSSVSIVTRLQMGRIWFSSRQVGIFYRNVKMFITRSHGSSVSMVTRLQMIRIWFSSRQGGIFFTEKLKMFIMRPHGSSVSIVTRLQMGWIWFNSRQGEFFYGEMTEYESHSYRKGCLWGVVEQGKTGLRPADQFHVLPILIMRGAVPPIPNASSCCFVITRKG
jgi:frataxin-like iron-binding protein CyaY